MRSLAARALVALVVGLLLLAFPTHAAAKDWRIESMDVALDVQQSGDVLVSEDVTFAFEGSFSYVARVIPTDSLGAIADVQVYQDGRPLPRGDAPGSYQVFEEGDDLVVQLAFDLTDTSETWTIAYRASDVVGFYDEGDEFVWRVFDADTPVAIDRLGVTVTLPGSVAPEEIRWAVETGSAVESTVSTPAPSRVVFDAVRFFPYTKYWIAVGFPKGVVDFTWTPARLAAAVVPRAGFLLPIAAFLGMLVVWFRRGRDEPAAAYARYATEPPSTLPPAAAGALLDERVESRALFAALADLARRGYLELPETQADKTTWRVRKLTSIEALDGSDAFVADRLFAAGDDTVKWPQLQIRLGQIANGFDKAVFGDLLSRGYFAASPDAVRRHWRSRAISLAFIMLGVTVALAMVGVGGWGYLALGSVASVAVVYGFARVMPQRTRKGAEEQRKWEAFRNYLRDMDRLADVETAREIFEQYLPYAIAFGVEKRWVGRFEGLLVPVPEWLGPVVGPPTFRTEEGEGPTAAEPVTAEADTSGSARLGDLVAGLSEVTLSSVSDRLFGGLDQISNVLTSAPSSIGSGGGAFGSSSVTWESDSSSGSSSSSSDSFSGSSSSWGDSGGFSSGGGDSGGGGGGFRAG